jgi:hypothetical protein
VVRGEDEGVDLEAGLALGSAQHTKDSLSELGAGSEQQPRLHRATRDLDELARADVA